MLILFTIIISGAAVWVFWSRAAGYENRDRLNTWARFQEQKRLSPTLYKDVEGPPFPSGDGSAR